MLLVIAASKSMHQINPDAVAYLRTAHYYETGRFGLAINGYWGPLISWIMAPLLRFNENDLLVARLAMGFSAVIFLIGALQLYRAIRLSLLELTVAAVLTSLFSVPWSVSFITPDLLMSGLLLLGLACSLAVRPDGSGTRPFGAGLLYGLAYLAKPVALPVSIGVILGLSALRAASGAATWSAAKRSAALSLAGLALISLPWIVVLSVHYGAPTFSTSGLINHAIVGPTGADRGHPTFRTHHVPESGRITSWEDPSGLPYETWSPFSGPERLQHQVKLILKNTRTIVQTLRGFDWLGLGLVAAVAGFVFHYPWAVGLREQPWRLVAPTLVAICGIYLPVYAADGRYYLACYPLLLAASFGFFGDLARRAALRRSVTMPSWVHASFRTAVLALVLVSFSLEQRFRADAARAFTTGFNDEGLLVARELADSLQAEPAGAIASVGDRRRIALYTAFLTGRPYYGDRVDEPSPDELVLSGARYIVVERGSALDAMLEEHPGAEPSAPQSQNSGGDQRKWPVRLYRLLQQRRPARAPRALARFTLIAGPDKANRAHPCLVMRPVPG
ncbi:MAG: hypothetical protein ACREJ0_19990 [Geminicoccaceae bacterium]